MADLRTPAPPLREDLRGARAILGELPEPRPAGAARALDRLDRDLLPRTADDLPYLVAGIVGPNNAGKSALFNALVGRALSPSVPTGGSTRRLVGALHPELLGRLTAEPTLARFPIEVGSPAPEGGVGETDDAARLFADTLETIPPNLLLIDTPDFDSILTDNRLASESLLAVADLAIAVVTRHSYQNREVVEYLARWLAHGRPWMLVYNEAVDDEVVREHAAKLAADVGSEPRGVFAAPLDLEIQRGEAALAPVSLGLGSVAAGRGLREVLFDLAEVEELKASALEASLAQLRDDLGEVVASLEREAGAAREVRDLVVDRAHELGTRLASRAMPAGPFAEAFRTVLDRRSKPWTRGLRGGLRRLRLGIERLPSLFRSGPAPEEAPLEERLARVEAQELERLWPDFWEDLARDLGPEGRDPVRASLRPELAGALDRDLGADRSAPAREAALSSLSSGAVEVAEFQEVCEGLVERAIEERGYDWDIQAGANLAVVAPLAVAAVLVVKTGGLGADLGVAGGGAVGTYLTEKYSHLLGSGITREAGRRWARLRAESLAPLLLGALLPAAGGTLEAAATAGAERAAELARIREGLA